jgi:hypothetical protein
MLVLLLWGELVEQHVVVICVVRKLHLNAVNAAVAITIIIHHEVPQAVGSEEHLLVQAFTVVASSPSSPGRQHESLICCPFGLMSVLCAVFR